MSFTHLKQIRDKFTRNFEIIDEGRFKALKAYLASFPEPLDLYERSYFQYKCQNRLASGSLLKAVENFVAIITYKKSLKKWYFANENVNAVTDCYDRPTAVFFNSLGLDIVPHEIKEQYMVLFDDKFSVQCLNKKDMDFLKGISYKYERSPFFLLKVAYKIAYYRGLISKYNPSAIVATSEYSFTSSILTEFCRLNNVRHINIMHGEKYFDMIATFFEFDECYVWDEDYINLFSEMRAGKNQFKISCPRSLMISTDAHSIQVDYKFYLQMENKETLKKLSNIVTELLKQGKTLKVRPHPLHIDMDLLKKFFSFDIYGINIIENPIEVAIEKSICESDFLVSRNSTVLYQGWLNGKKTIIDDITKRQEYLLLNELGYIMLKKPVELLSEHLCKSGDPNKKHG